MLDRILTESNILSFEQNMISEEKGNVTIEKYVRDIKLFYNFADGRLITKEIVIEYKKNLIEKGYSTRSVNSMLASINSLFSFLGWFDCRVKSLKIQQEIFRPEEKELSKSEYFSLTLGNTKFS
jgi:site-specific recombinase XerD